MRTRVVIQSRLTSSRLPGKALLTLAGMPLIELVARRAANTGHEVVVATSDEQYDRRIAEHLEGVGLDVVRGPLDDVLARFVTAAAGLSDTDRVVRLTGDNPVADGALVDELVAAVERSPHDYGRVDIDRVPEGFGAEVFSAGVLREAADRARSAYDREHVTPWIRRSGGELLFVPDGAPTDLYAYRCTIDCLDDYDRVCGAFAGVEDPVAVPWQRPRGPRGRRVAGRGSRPPPQPGPRSPPPRVRVACPRTVRRCRDLFTVAVSHGISHTLLHDEAAQRAHRAGTTPRLRQRLARGRPRRTSPREPNPPSCWTSGSSGCSPTSADASTPCCSMPVTTGGGCRRPSPVSPTSGRRAGSVGWAWSSGTARPSPGSPRRPGGCTWPAPAPAVTWPRWFVRSRPCSRDGSSSSRTRARRVRGLPEARASSTLPRRTSCCTR